MKAWTRSLILFLGAPLGFAQEIRYPTFTANMELASSVVFSAQAAHLLWIGNDFCATANGEGLRREMRLDGTFTSGDVAVFSTCLGAQYPRVAVNTAGVFIVVVSGGPSDTLARLFDASWSPLSVEFAVNSLLPAERSKPDVTALPSGDFVVAWTRNPANFSDLYARVVRPDGSMPNPEVFVPEDPTDGEQHENVITLPTGNPMVIWLGGDSATLAIDIRGRVFDGSLSPLGGDVTIGGAAPNRTPRAAASPYGAIVVWEEPTAATSIVGRLLDSTGSPVGSEFAVSTNTSSTKYDAWCAMDASGRAIVAWTSSGQDGSSAGAYAQRLDAAGNKIGSEFRVNSTTYMGQGGCRAGMSPSGDFIITWYTDHNFTQTFGDTYMRRYFFPVSLVLGPGRGSGNPPAVAAVRPDGTTGSASFWAYGTNGYGANVGAGNIDGVTTAEILTGPGPSPVYGPHVRGFRATGSPMGKVSYYAYGTLKFGVRTAGGDVDGDAYDEILTAPGEGAVFGPHVRGWNFDGLSLTPISKISFFAYNTLKYGARAAGGDVDGDGIQEILTAPGPGAAFLPQIRGWQYDGIALSQIQKIVFWAFSGPVYGATVSSADVESDGRGGYGDGYQEILAGVGPDPGASARAALFDFDNATLTRKYDIYPYPGLSYGVSVAGGDADAGDVEEVVTAPGPNPASTADVIVWEWHMTPTDPDPPRLEKLGPDQFTWMAPMTYGANVAVGTFE